MTYKELFEAQLEYNREAIAAKLPDDFKALDLEIIYMLLLRYLEDLEDRKPDGAEY